MDLTEPVGDGATTLDWLLVCHPWLRECLKPEIAARHPIAPPVDVGAIWRNPERCGGRPTVAGTRFWVSQLLHALADGGNIRQVAAEYGYDDPEPFRAALRQIAVSPEWGHSSGE